MDLADWIAKLVYGQITRVQYAAIVIKQTVIVDLSVHSIGPLNNFSGPFFV